MRVIFIIVVVFNFTSYAQQWDWAVAPTTQFYGEPRVASDNSGNSFFCCSPFNFPSVDSCQLVKYNTYGMVTWTKNLGSNVQVKGMAADKSGQVYLSGCFTGTVTVNGTTLISSGNKDAFLFKLNFFGQPVWMKTFAGTGDDISNDVYVDQAATIYVTGSLSANAVVEGNSLPQKGLFICKFDTNGNLLNTIRSTKGGEGLLLRTDSLKNIYLLGTLSDTLYLDTVVHYPPYYYYATNYIVKFDPSGTYNWFVPVGNVQNLGVDPLGNSYISYSQSYSGTTVKQYTSQGALGWTRHFSSMYSSSNGITVDKKGAIFITGSLSNLKDTSVTFLWGFNSQGKILDEVVTKPQQKMFGRSVVLDLNDNIYLLGGFYDSLDLGPFHLVRNNYLNYFLSRIEGKRASAGFNSSQPYEAQNIFFTERCFADTFFKWEFPGGNPSFSYEKDPVVSYSAGGKYSVKLFAYNAVTCDTLVQQVYVRPEPHDSVYIKKIPGYGNWGGNNTPVSKTSDGGCILSGSGLYKFNSIGSLEWISSAPVGSYIQSVVEIPDAYILLSNHTTLISSNSGVTNPVISKTDRKGKLQWIKDFKDTTLPYACSTNGWGLCATDEGGFIFGGSSTIRCDSAGNIEWQKKFPFYPTRLERYGNDKYLIQGVEFINNVACSFIAQINGDGSMNWIKGFDSTLTGTLNHFLVMSNGDFVIYGYLWGPDPNHFILRLDPNGNMIWAKTLYVDSTTWFQGITEAGKGKTMFIGSYNQHPDHRIVLVLMDEDGNVEWNRTTDSASFAFGGGLIGLDQNQVLCFGYVGQNNVIAKVTTRPPSCFRDSINVFSANRLVNPVIIPQQVGSTHFKATLRQAINESWLTMPVIPEMECTANPVITDIISFEDVEGDLIRIFPNPTSGKFTVQSEHVERIKLKVFDILGNEIDCQLHTCAEGFQADLQKNGKGLYFVEITVAPKRTVKKIIIE